MRLIKFATMLTVFSFAVGCSYDQSTSEQKSLSDGNFFAETGGTVGLVNSAEGTKTFAWCETLGTFNALKNSGLTEAGYQGAIGGCEMLLKYDDKVMFLSAARQGDLKLELQDYFWKRCLSTQYWFCDGDKVNAQVERLFSAKEDKVYWNGEQEVELYRAAIKTVFPSYWEETVLPAQ